MKKLLVFIIACSMVCCSTEKRIPLYNKLSDQEIEDCEIADCSLPIFIDMLDENDQVICQVFVLGNSNWMCANER